MIKSSTKSVILGTFLLFSLNFSVNYAQQLPNSGFETFENGYNGVGQQPTGWKGSNVKTTYSGTTVTANMVGQAAGHSGNGIYCHNEFAGALGIGAAAPAYVSLGQPWNDVYGMSVSSAGGGNEGGINWTYRPDSVQLWIKRTYSSQEDMVVSFYLWSGEFKSSSYRNKGDSECHNRNQTNEETDIHGTNRCGTTQQGSLIANAEWRSGQQYNDWYLVKFPVNYYNNSVPQKANMIICAANYPSSNGIGSSKEGSKMWADDVQLIYSSQIAEIRLNNFPYNSFDRNVYEYTKSLGEGISTIPTITCFRSGRQLLGSEITVQQGQVDGAPTIITVTAEDGSSTSTYTIHFVSQVSNNPRLTMININGNPVPNFNGYVPNYNIALPYGTTICPTITVVKGDDGQNVTINPCTGVPGSVSINVVAADGIATQSYTLNFTVAQLNDNTLTNILLNGEGIPNFVPTQNNYTVELPLGTTVAPTITTVSAYPQGEQTILVTDNGLSGQSTILVYSPASTQRTYRINYVITASSNSSLSDIKVGGQTISGFNSSQLNYSILLPRGTTQLPDITYTKGDVYQTVNVSLGGVNGETKLTVTAQNGSISIYRLNFSVERSTFSKLNDILVGGSSVGDFDPDTLNYHIELPSGAIAVPAITYELGDYAQTVQISNGGLAGITTLKVKAEDPAYTSTYSLTFNVIQSANAQLDMIYLNGDSLIDFAPDVLEYNYLISESENTSPTITVDKGSAGQTVVIISPERLGLATIEVKPETGYGFNIYKINFLDNQSNNNSLSEISLFGTEIDGFNPEDLDYAITLPIGSSEPVVDYVVADSTAHVVVINNGFNGYQINVYAQNGDLRTYTLSFVMQASQDVKLADIQLWNESSFSFTSLAGFDEDVYIYGKTLAWRTAKVPVINPIANNLKQQIEVIYGELNDTTEIRVTAEDGVTQASYYIYFPVTKSGVNTLSSITIDGVEVSGWHPQITNFPILLPYGTTAVPNISYDKAMNPSDNSVIWEQKVEVVAGNINEASRVIVTAENGSTRTYSLVFTVDKSSLIGENYLNNIFVGGSPVAGFSRTTYSYTVNLPYGTTTMPEITVTKNYPEQSIVITDGGLNGTSVVRVYSNVQGIMPLDYSINIKVSDLPTTTLTSISFDDIVFSGFDPKVHSYIVPVTSQPAVSYVYDDVNLVAQVDVNNHKKFQLTVANPNTSESNVYAFWYYYTNDVIPNGMFENFTGQANGGQKPTSWTCQGDVRDKVGSFNLDDQVQMSTDHSEGARSVYMQIQYNGSTTGDEAGIITTGSISSSGSTLGGHSTSCNGGINFRNTPDAVTFDYKYSSPRNGMYFALRLWNTGSDYSSGQSVSVVTNTDGAERSSFYTKTLGINYSGDNRYPQRMNIVLSPSGNENSYIYPTGSKSKLWVDNMRLGYNSTLTNLFVSGVAVPSFVGTTNNLTCYADVPAESMTAPAITFSNAVPDQEVRINITDENSSRQRTVSILSKAEDNITATQYWLILTRSASTNTSLANITVNGMPVAGFNASTLTYNVPVPNGSMKDMPNLNVVKGEGHQSIAYAFANAVVTITVTADNGSTSVYTLNLVETQSDNALLVNLEVEGYDINFSPVTFNYDVVLSNSVLDIPKVIFTKNSDGQTVIFNANHIGENTTVKVFAEDSINSNTYNINFYKNPVVTSNLLSKIAINDLVIDAFDKETFDYSIAINKTQHQLYFEKEFEADEIIVEYQENFAKYYIGENIYTVDYQYTTSNNALLANILIEGISIDNFIANQFHYSLTTENGNIKDVSVVLGEEHQSVTITISNNVITLTVLAEDGITEAIYTVNFDDAIPPSDNSLLIAIELDGTLIDNFMPDTFDYSVMLPEGTTVMPIITTIKGDVNQTVTVNSAGVLGTTTIVVEAEDGSSSVYTINFDVTLSENALLAEILVAGEIIDDFDPEIFDYDYLLPYQTTEVPLVEYVKGHHKQVIYAEDGGIHGDYSLLVKAEDTTFTNTYTIHFDVALSPYSTLDMIFTDELEVPNFDKDIYEYQVILPYGTSDVPEITWIETDTLSEIVFVAAATLADTAFIYVTSQDGENSNVYSLSFTVLLSSNALLSDISINNESISTEAIGFISEEDFEPTQFDYNIVMPYGTIQMPDIQFVTQVPRDDYFSIIYTNNNLNAISTIEVTSEDRMNVETYSLNVTVAKSDDASLADLSVFGNTISGFNSDTLVYDLVYPPHTDVSELATLADVEYIIADTQQVVETSINSDYVILISVTAGNGNVKTYVITQTILKCDNNLLADILVDGVSLDSFEPEKFTYSYILPFGTSIVPDLDYVKQEDIQEVSISKGFVNEASYIFVTAEDGSIAEYSILFTTSLENPGDETTYKDVCFAYAGEGLWQASSWRHNVSLVIVDITGRVFARVDVPVINPNYELCNNPVGIRIHIPQKGGLYFYTFIYNNKKPIKKASGKFVW